MRNAQVTAGWKKDGRTAPISRMVEENFSKVGCFFSLWTPLTGGQGTGSLLLQA